ncbi:hypothetical protein B4U79_17584 [Dinothrombium tinctorium]|uniref:Aspartic peptidase DDI1-type domain-containing protein n=1 Tax=Dinothrombium tinctorium TaxID=1965070 RepID=A0A3S3PDP9_9ACAR|nr:hypothetical protein B4U79_17584 [Dinothrombium tinctorium]
MQENPIRYAWIKLAFPNLNKALKSKKPENVSKAIKKMQTEFPYQTLDTLENTLKWIEEQRLSRIKIYEDIAAKEFPDCCNRYSTVFKCKVNGVSTFGLIDSGAERTFIGMSVAKKCKMLHLVDNSVKYVSRAYGIGDGKFIGRIHVSMIILNEEHKIAFPISVLNKFHLHCIMFGIDFLKHYDCIIDYSRNVLVLKKLNIEVPFVSECCPCCLIPSDSEHGRRGKN